MTGIIEGTACRTFVATVTTNTTEELRTNAGFGVPKFAVVDVYLRSTSSSLNTTNSEVTIGYGHTRILVAGTVMGAAGIASVSLSNVTCGTNVGLSGVLGIPVSGMDGVASTVDITLVTDGVDITFAGTDISSGAAIGYVVARMYTGRNILNASIVNQPSNTTASPVLAYQPNTLLAMTSELVGNQSRSLSFGACDYNLNQASYGMATVPASSTYGTISSNTKALHSVQNNGSYVEQVRWEVTAFTATGWTNTVSTETYARTIPILVLALELEDPTEFEVGISTDTTSLSSTVELDHPYGNLNWETIRNATLNNIDAIGGSSYIGLNLVSNTADTNLGIGWAVLAGSTSRHQFRRPVGDATTAYMLEDVDTRNSWTSTTNAASTEVSYALTTGTAVSEACVYLSWGFVKPPLYNILVGEEYPSLTWVGSGLSIETHLGSTSLNNYV